MKKVKKAILTVGFMTIVFVNFSYFPNNENVDTKLVHFRIENHNTDTIVVEVYENLFQAHYYIEPERKFLTKRNGKFSFNMGDVNQPHYLSVSTVKEGETENVFTLYLVEPGDDIVITLKSKEHDTVNNVNELRSNDRYWMFSGNGNAKYGLQRDMEKSRYDEQLRLLNKHIMNLSEASYSILYADIVGRKLLNELNVKASQANRNGEYLSAFTDDMAQFDNDYILFSRYYMSYLLERALQETDNDSYVVVADRIVSYYHGDMKDVLLQMMLLKNIKWMEKEQVDKIIDLISSSKNQQMIEDYTNSLFKGKKAKAFSLPDIQGNIVNLDDYKGKVVLLDFWFTGCFACAAYYEEVISKVEEIYDNNDGVVFISISVDKRKEIWLNTVHNPKSNKYTSMKVINLYTEGKGTDHQIVYDYRVNVFPNPVLIDRNGNIYSSNFNELRYGGAERLRETIDAALGEVQ